jgi:glycosyl transferase family 25
MKCIYINLDRRVDRRCEIEAELERMGIEAERFSAIERDPGGIGCTASHIAVLKLARERGYEEVMILEDDFSFKVSKDELEQALKSLPASYDMVLLAFKLIRGVPSRPPLGRVLEAQTTGGYIIHSRYYNTLIDRWTQGLELYEMYPDQHWNYILDQYWKPLQKVHAWYYFIKPIGMQRPSWSDLGKQMMVDYH